jgi:dephospho-CoA kinase
MRIAVTGGIAEGKSTVMRMLHEMGASCISADAIAKDVFWREDVQEALAVLLEVEEPVSQVTLRSAIAVDENLRRDVNQLIHPAVLEEIQKDESTFVEIPLLMETIMHTGFDAVWVVSCGAVEQRRRLEERYANTPAMHLVDTQLSTSARSTFADAIVRTDCPEAETKAQLIKEAKTYGLRLVVS